MGSQGALETSIGIPLDIEETQDAAIFVLASAQSKRKAKAGSRGEKIIKKPEDRGTVAGPTKNAGERAQVAEPSQGARENKKKVKQTKKKRQEEDPLRQEEKALA